MAARMDGETLRWLDALNRDGSTTGMGDGPLLDRFLSSPGPAGEAAFEALVRRHGPMVLALCRGVLRDEHDADDAFQATFLVLARRAATLRDRDRLAAWLGRTARRIALRARKDAALRRSLERRRDEVDAGAAEAPAEALVAAEAAALVGAEVDRLPEPDRLLMRLTYWQGKTYEEAAEAVSRPVGTVRSRLARARDRLRERLSRLDPGAAGPMLAGRAPTPTEALIRQAVRAASPYAGAAGAATAAGTVPTAVAALVEGEIAMTTYAWKPIAGLLIVGGAVTAGAVTRTPRSPEPAPPPAAPAARPAPEEEKKAEAASLLANGGVEEGGTIGPKAWSKGAEVPGVEYIWSRDAGHGGKASLCLKKTVRRYFPIAEWTQKLARKGDAPRLKVSAWIKAEKAGKAILDAQFLDDKGEWSHAWVAYIGARKPNDPPADHDWKRYEGVVEIPPSTKEILVAPQIYGPGTVWFDDLKAEYTEAPATDPIGT